MWAWVPIWSQIEVDVGIVVASLPSLNPLLKQVWKGSSKKRSLTPSQLPDFPEYQQGWNPGGSPSAPDFDVEKSRNHSATSFYDESSDTEDEIDKAKLAVPKVKHLRRIR